MNKISFLSFILLVALGTGMFAQTSDVKPQKKLITLEDIWVNYSFYPQSIRGLHSMNNGVHYTQIDRDGIVKYSYKTGEKVEVLVERNKLKPNADTPPINFTQYNFSADEQKVLLFADNEQIYRHSFVARNYVWDIENAKLTEIANGQKQRLATFNPSADKIAYVRDNNIFIFDLTDNTEKQITSDGKTNEIINGAPDWVYEEEFGFDRGFYWSPKGDKIAFMRFNESGVKQWSLRMYGELYPEDYAYKYPKAGEDNSIVEVFVYDLKSGKTIKMQTGDNPDQYIPRIKWTQDNNKLAIIRLNRLQNHLDLLLCNAKKGDSEVIFSEDNKYFIDITDDLTFLKNGKEFIWSSEADGYNHLYLYNLKGTKIRQITSGPWDVASFKGIDEKKGIIYYTSSEKGPQKRTLYKIGLNGKNKKELSKKSGTNDADFSKTFAYYINTYSDANTPAYITLNNSKGKEIRVLQDNKALNDALSEYQISQKEFFTFKTVDGTELNGWMIKPYNFTKNRKYPVFMTVYGGPGHNTVNDAWEYTMLWHQMLAQKGYIVVSVDPRGTGFRGEKFKKSTYMQLGKLETEDMIEAAKYLGNLPWVDADRIGIQGWSYGGYLSSSSLFKGADYFKMAIAVAPVTNWRYYDNIYTERYMRTPQENPEGYDENSPINFAKNLKGKFLLIHGAADDNVHFQNTMELVKALNDAGKQFDMHIYPNKNHGIYGGLTRYHLFTKMTNFIVDNL